MAQLLVATVCIGRQVLQYRQTSESSTVRRITFQAVNWMNEFGRGGGSPPRRLGKGATRGLKNSDDEGRDEKRASWASMTLSMDGEDPWLQMSYARDACTGYLGHVATASVRAQTCTDVLQPRCTGLHIPPESLSCTPHAR